MLLTHLFEKQNAATGTYAAVTFSDDTIKSLLALQEQLEVPSPLSEDKFHTTLLYSRKELPNYIAAGKLQPVITSDDIDFTLDIWPNADKTKRCLVLKYECQWLLDRHNELMEEHGATFDYPEYNPHITLSYDVGPDWEMKDATVHFKNQKPITIVSEYSEPLNLDWSK